MSIASFEIFKLTVIFPILKLSNQIILLYICEKLYVSSTWWASTLALSYMPSPEDSLCFLIQL